RVAHCRFGRKEPPHVGYYTGIIRQFHHVIEIPLTAPDVKESQLTRMLTRDLFEALDAFKFALERALILERVTPHNFQAAQNARGATRKPHFSIRPAADATQQLVIGDEWRRVERRLILQRGSRDGYSFPLSHWFLDSPMT